MSQQTNIKNTWEIMKFFISDVTVLTPVVMVIAVTTTMMIISMVIECPFGIFGISGKFDYLVEFLQIKLKSNRI